MVRWVPTNGIAFFLAELPVAEEIGCSVYCHPVNPGHSGVTGPVVFAPVTPAIEPMLTSSEIRVWTKRLGSALQAGLVTSCISPVSFIALLCSHRVCLFVCIDTSSLAAFNLSLLYACCWACKAHCQFRASLMLFVDPAMGFRRSSEQTVSSDWY